MNTKPEIIFSFPSCMGGVASLNYNLLKYSKLKSVFFVKVILIKAKEDERPIFLEKFNADETLIFEHSSKENKYYVLKRLSKLLGHKNGAIVCDNLLTIQSAALFNCPKTIYHYLHDFFYVKQNIEAGNMVDVAVTHSTFFQDCAFAADPINFKNRSFYIPYGVKQLKKIPLKLSSKLNLVFLGRLEESKGVLLLHEIDKKITAQGLLVNWSIIGKGILKKQLENQWQNNLNVKFFEPSTTDEVFSLLEKQDLFIFPTRYEGTPVSILESCSCGVIPIVSDLPGGIRDIVKDGIGFLCKMDDVNDFSDRIISIATKQDLMKMMQNNCFNLTQNTYDIKKNSDKYFDFFMKYKEMKRTRKDINIRLSRLDKAFIPNFITSFIRNLRS